MKKIAKLIKREESYKKKIEVTTKELRRKNGQVLKEKRIVRKTEVRARISQEKKKKGKWKT